jgi:hypothetical protein
LTGDTQRPIGARINRVLVSQDIGISPFPP